MSTKKESTQTIQYDPTSMNTFKSIQSPFQNYLLDSLKSPFTSDAFKARVEMGNKTATGLGARYMQNLLQNPYLGSNRGAFTASETAKIGRATGALQANNIYQNLIAQEGIRQNAAQMASAYRPLQTGQTSVEKTSGTGTWLPQLLGAGLQAGMMAATGGFSGAASAASGGSSALSAAATAPSRFAAFQTNFTPYITGPKG